jgi:hypothetical protein
MTIQAAEAQRATALAKANAIRSGKKRVKERLRAGDLTLATALQTPRGFVRELRFEEMLLAIPRIGPHKTRRILGQARVSASAKVGSRDAHTRLRVLEVAFAHCPLLREERSNAS